VTDRPVLLVTGTSRGIGRALAAQYAGPYRVVGVSRSPTDLTHEAYRHVQADVTDEAAVLELFRELRATEGRLDALVNNAGIASMNSSLLTPLDTFRRVVDVNLLGTFLFCREAARLMQARRHGRIVNFTTVAVPLRLAGEAAYAAAKAAVKSLTEVLAFELGPLGITVNAVGPTPLDTDLIKGVPREKIDALVARQAIPRQGEIADVLNAVDFFLRPESGFVTGQTLYLGGF